MSKNESSRSHRSGRIKDAEGRTVQALDPMWLFMLERRDVIEPDALEKIAETLEPGARRSRSFARLMWFVVVPAVVLFIAASVLIEGQAAWKDLARTLTNPAILVALVGGGLAPWLVARQRRLKRVKRVMLKHARCPHCGYDLRASDPRDDHLTVCPECACAWRLDDPEIKCCAGAPVRATSAAGSPPSAGRSPPRACRS